MRLYISVPPVRRCDGMFEPRVCLSTGQTFSFRSSDFRSASISWDQRHATGDRNTVAVKIEMEGWTDRTATIAPKIIRSIPKKTNYSPFYLLRCRTKICYLALTRLFKGFGQQIDHEKSPEWTVERGAKYNNLMYITCVAWLFATQSELEGSFSENKVPGCGRLVRGEILFPQVAEFVPGYFLTLYTVQKGRGRERWVNEIRVSFRDTFDTLNLLHNLHLRRPIFWKLPWPRPLGHRDICTRYRIRSRRSFCHLMNSNDASHNTIYCIPIWSIMIFNKIHFFRHFF